MAQGKDPKDQVMHIFAVAPDWSGKDFCSGSEGYDPFRITAPSISYTGIVKEEPVYEYRWMLKLNDGDWSTVASSKKSPFVPSYDPPVLKSEDGELPRKYYWKLEVQDIANKDERLTSDTIGLTLYSNMKVSYQVKKTNSDKVSILVNVKGGSGKRTYQWKADGANSVSKEKSKLINPGDVLPGVYHLTILDEKCGELNLTIDTAKPPPG